MAVDYINMGGRNEVMDVDGGVKVQPQARVDTVEDILETLLRNATDEFDFAPRDVFKGVFDLPGTKDRHATAMKNLECAQANDPLQDILR